MINGANSPDGYMQAVSDDELIALIDAGVSTSTTSFNGSSELTAEREQATYEYTMKPFGHLKPQGVSGIVSSDSVEAVEGYTAVLSELLFDNNKLAKFLPYGPTPTDYHTAKKASDLTNYCIFRKNPGWATLNTWIKSALMWKDAWITWDYEENFEYSFEEYEVITQEALDIALADPDVEIVGDLYIQDDGSYIEVRLRRKINKSGVKIRNIPPENQLVSDDASCRDDASFIGYGTEMTRSEIRKTWGEKADDIKWESVPTSYRFNQAINTDSASRKRALGQHTVSTSRDTVQEATQIADVITCWVRVDRDGDGIAELKKIIKVGDVVLYEEDVEAINIATLTPFEIPHEFRGLAMTDMVRPSTLTSTAILRGFVENTYLTNYAPKIADPNVVDFSALQNLKPKQVVASNGNPTAAVQTLAPETISTGTVPLLEFLQAHKEQATGLSKAAQGLNDTLYVSGNSEQKVSAVQSAAQTRIQYIARRFMETGLKDLCEGVYKTMVASMRGQKTGYYDSKNFYQTVEVSELPSTLMLMVEADVGDASNQTVLQKMQIIGQQILPALKEAGAGSVPKPEAAAQIAARTFEALGEDPLDYIVDFTTDEFKAAAMESQQRAEEEAQRQQALEQEAQALKIALDKANVDYTNVQSQNAIQDNLKQLLVALDKSQQEWADLAIKAGKEQQPMPQQPEVTQLYTHAQSLLKQVMTVVPAQPETPVQQ